MFYFFKKNTKSKENKEDGLSGKLDKGKSDLFFNLFKKIKFFLDLARKKFPRRKTQIKTFPADVDFFEYRHHVLYKKNKRRRFLSKFRIIANDISRLFLRVQWKRAVASFLMISVIASSLIFLNRPKSVNADYTNNMNQVSWAGGADTSAVVTTATKDGWNKYYSKSSNMSAGNDISSTIQTAGANIDFTNEADYIQENATYTNVGGGTAELALSAPDNYTKLLIHADEANGSTTFTDSSSSNRTITNVGSVTASNTTAKFGNSAYLSGGNYLEAATSADLNFGGGTYTIDFWFYGTGAVNNVLMSRWGGDNSARWAFYFIGDSNLAFWNGSTWITFETGITDNVWHHLAWTYDAGANKIYMDGVLTAEISHVFGDINYPIQVGATSGVNNYVGYIDEVRFSKGILRWNSDFTPPTSKYATYPTGQAYYVTTSDNSQINTSTWNEISSINITESTPANTDIKYLVSFDGRTTWKYWNGSSWAVSSLDNLQTNGMTKSALEALSSANLNSSGGFQSGVTTALNFAADLITNDSNNTPSLDQITVNYAVSHSEDLISSKFDSGSDNNSMGGISWIEDGTLPAGSQVSLSLRTASSESGLDSASWSVVGISAPSSLTPGCSKSTGTVTCGINTIPALMKTGGDDRWFQYKIIITSGAVSPTVTNINPIYQQDIIPPSITSITSTTPNGEYNQGDVINITLNFSENVVSSTGLTVTLDTGGVINIPAWSTPVPAVVGNYTVGAGHVSNDLTVASVSGEIADRPANSVVFSSITIPFTNESDYIEESSADTEFNSGIARLTTSVDSYTKLLIHANESNGSTTFIDSSSSGHAISALGGTTASNAVTKFGNSTYFNGTPSASISIPYSNDFNFNGGDYTTDLWFYGPGTPGTALISRWSTTASLRWGIYFSGEDELAFYNGAGWTTIQSGIAENTWHHFAWTYTGGTNKIYIDGVLRATISRTLSDTGYDLQIGSVSGSNNYSGYIDEVRMSKGILRWTTNFTPPIEEYAGYNKIQPYYITTSDASQLNVSALSEISGVSVTQATPIDTSIKYLVSFDDRTTWKYWNGSAWTASSLDNLQTDGMTKETLEGLSTAIWSASGGFAAGITTTLDFAADLTSSNSSATPGLDSISVNYPNSSSIDSSYVNTSTNPSHTASNLATNANLKIDNVAPSSVVSVPNGTTAEYSQISISGTASDNNTLNRVEISIQDTDTGNYWTGSGWGSETWLLTAGTTSWNYGSSVNWTVDNHFTVRSRATDQAGNIEAPSAGKSFIFINSPPTVTVNSVTKVNGNVAVNYDIEDVESSSTTVSLVYDSSATLSNDLDASSASSIQVSNTAKFPASGAILLENNSSATPRYEYVTYTNINGNYLEGITRGANGTLAHTHDSGIVVRIKASVLSGDSGIVNNGTGKSLIWNSAVDTSFYNNTQTISVVSDDGASANEIGIDTSNSFFFDTSVPVVSATSISAINNPAELTFDVIDNDNIQMMVSLNSDFSGASWESYAANKTISLATIPDTVYVKFKDSQENTTTVQELSTPATPQSLMIQDVSSVSQDKWKLYVSWQIVSAPLAGFEAYRIYRSNNADGLYVYQGSTASGDINVDYYADGVNQNESYYYKIATEDQDGNISSLSSYVWGTANATQDAGEGGGGSSGDITPPNITAGPTVESVTVNSATINWTTGENSDSFIEYGTTNSYGSVFGNPDLTTIHSVSLPAALSSSTTYHYRIRTRDSAGNLTISGDGTFATEEGNDSVAPVIANVSIGDPTSSSVEITWTTDENSNSLVDFGTIQGVYTITQGNSEDSTTDHSVILTSLNPSTAYFFQIKSKDSYDNQRTDNNSGLSYSFTTDSSPDPGDVTAPIISNITISDLSTNEVTINWTTDEDSDSVVGYSLDNSYSQEKGIISLTQSHSVTLIGLNPQSIYYFQIKSRDAAGNLRIETNPTVHTFTTDGEEPNEDDVTPPTISDIMVSDLTYKTATITWTTNENSNSLVDYGTSNSFGESHGNRGASKTAHSVTIPDLKALTTYYFKVSSADVSSNSSSQTTDSSGEILSFTTLSASLDADDDGEGDQLTDISNDVKDLIDQYDYTEKDIHSSLSELYSITSDGPSAKITDNTTVTITWDTSKEANGKVFYWQDGNNESSAISVSETGEIDNNHEIVIKNLGVQIKYNYYVISATLLGSEFKSETKTFTAGDIPTISSINVTDISLDGAVISWVTNSISSLKVEYGNSSKYGKEISSSSNTSKSNHAAKLEGLETGKEYHFRIKGVDADKEEVSSDDYSFRTLELPKISDIYVKEVASERVIVSWTTNTKTDSSVEYKLQESDKGISQGKLESVTEHEVVLENLIPGTNYQYKVSSKDPFGNKSESEYLSFTTIDDSGPPSIGGVKSEATVFPNKETKIQTIISWSTDKPTDSIVAYKEGRIEGGDGIEEKMKDKDVEEYNGWKIYRKQDSSFNHMFVFTEFNPSSVYYFKIASIDKRGNISVSDNYSLITPVKKKSIFDLIVGNFEETFGWVKKIGK